jgi:hypothetical protein
MNETPESDFKFIPEYAESIAHIASNWATLEFYINDTIWTVAGLDRPTGACITSQIYTIQGRLAALLALLKLRRAPNALIAKVNKYSESIRGPQEMRNRVVHDVWLMDNHNPDTMGRLETTAPKKLSFKVQDVPLSELRDIQQTLSKVRAEASDLRLEIVAALPSFPGIPESERDPIAHVR